MALEKRRGSKKEGMFEGHHNHSWDDGRGGGWFGVGGEAISSREGVGSKGMSWCGIPCGCVGGWEPGV